MNKNNTVKKGISLVIILIMTISLVIPQKPVEAATNSNIKIYNFIKLLVPAAGIDIDTSQSNPYLKAAMDTGIVKEGDFEDYKAYLTRIDAALLLNRADEYLHGDTVDKALLQTVIGKRISDIKKIPAGKREAVAKIYAKGFIVGKSNGMYVQNRSFNGNDYLAAGDAKKVLGLLKNVKDRAKISPDGQLIRTKNLPKNAKDYPYILEAFPNSFYEMKFSYQRGTYSWKPVEGKDYARPVKITTAMSVIKTDETGMCIYVNDWIKKVKDNLNCRLNVNYHDIGNIWLNDLRRTYFIANNASLDKEQTDKIREYIKFVKKNQITLTSSVISVEPSTLYKHVGGYEVRVYVKFKVSFKNKKDNLNDPIFGNNRFVGLSKDKWFEGVYDIEIGTKNIGSDGSDFAVSDDTLNDFYYKGK